MQTSIIIMSSLAVFAQLQLVHIGASAQATTNATCFPSYAEWMHNEEGQSPCLVAAYLLSPCSTTGSGAFVPALNNSLSLYNFAGTSLESSLCVCNTVTFSMLYACATCQGAELAILPWYIVEENCSATFHAEYPEKISANTSVPRWAYLDISETGRVDISEAKSLASENEPDATVSGFYGAISPTASNNGFSPGWWEGDQLASDAQGVGVGVIVGASVGGSIGAIAIATALFFLIRASRRKRRAMANAADAPNVPPKGHSFDDVALTSAARLYNPDDPTTYPSFPTSTSEKATLQQAGGRAWIDYPAAIPSDSANSFGMPHDARPAVSEPVYPGQPEVTV